MMKALVYHGPGQHGRDTVYTYCSRGAALTRSVASELAG